MKLNPIKKQRVYQSILELFMKSIENNEIQPGDKLPSERDLAEKLVVSRTAVREAFSVLESYGIIKILPGIGVFLKENKKETILKEMSHIAEGKKNEVSILALLEVREAIEVQAAMLAALRRDENDLKEIQAAYKALETVVEKGDVAAKEDLNFHIAVVKASKNEMLVDIMKLFYNQFLQGVHDWRIKDKDIPFEHKISLDTEHYDVYLTILEHDPDRAKKAMYKHFENTKLSYLKY